VFTVVESSKRLLKRHKTHERHKMGVFDAYKLTPGDIFFCGVLGGAVNGAVFVSPVEYVRNTLIAQHSRRSLEEDRMGRPRMMEGRRVLGPFDVVGRTLRKKGISGLWRGMGVTVLRDSIGVGMFFFTFESTKRFITRYYYQGDATSATTAMHERFGITLLSGAAAGLGFWLVALPLDTAKTLVQTGVSPSATSVFREYWTRQGGLLEMYRGWQVAFGRGAPSAAVTVLTYDFVSRCLLGESD